jgi:glycerol-3-phosphate acyltransferase PlsY
MFIWPLAVGFFIAYLIGSIPFGLLLTRVAGLGDVRKIGSGNIGATNVLRTGNKAIAAATLALDIGKGFVAVALGWRFGGPDLAVLTAYGAMLGHCFPVWLKFKGGKGVATFLGVVTGLAAPLSLTCAVAWIVAVLITRWSSVGGILAAVTAPAAAYVMGDQQIFEATAIMALLVCVRHHENIKRLLKGEEPKIGKNRTNA